MREKFLQVRQLINGEKAADFKKNWFGEYLSGDVTFTFAEQPYTLTFHKGVLLEVFAGTNLTGLEMGVIGPEAGWQEFYKHKNFSRAIGPKHGKLRLQGNMVKNMGNLNCLGYLARTLCEVV